MVTRGADLSAVCERARYVQTAVLALMVPTLSSSLGMLSSAEVAELAPRRRGRRRSAAGPAQRPVSRD